MHRCVLILAVVLAGCGYDADAPADAGAGTDARELPIGDARPGAGFDADPALPACSNGIDDDCDGLVDFAGGDPGCASASDDDERGAGLVCDDGIDNDNDGLIDYVAPECGGGDPGCESPFDSTELDTPGPI